jgi:hypothetical protein
MRDYTAAARSIGRDPVTLAGQVSNRRRMRASDDLMSNGSE